MARSSVLPARISWGRSGLPVVIVASMLFSLVLFSSPPPAKADFLKIDTQQEISLGREASQEFEQKNRIVTSGPMYARVNRLAARITSVSGRDLPYTFKVVDAPVVNAVTFPGGFIYFYRGLLERSNDNQVACVLAHEIAHAVKSHTYKTLFALGMISKMSGPARKNAVAQILTAVTVACPLSRRLEVEADRIGAQLAYKGGYDPMGLVEILQMLDQLRTRQPNLTEKLLQSHPDPKDRIRRLMPVIEQLKSQPR